MLQDFVNVKAQYAPQGESLNGVGCPLSFMSVAPCGFVAVRKRVPVTVLNHSPLEREAICPGCLVPDTFPSAFLGLEEGEGPWMLPQPPP